MKAILYKKGGRENAVFTDVPDPVVGPNDVLARVYASYICRPADCAHDGGYSVFGRYPLIPGHEWSGIVEAVGKMWRTLKSETESLPTLIFHVEPAISAREESSYTLKTTILMDNIKTAVLQN